MYYILQVNVSKLINMARGGTQANINAKMVKEFKISIPPIHLQNKFDKILEQVEQLKQVQEKSKEEIDNLYNKLMQQAFKGEL